MMRPDLHRETENDAKEYQKNIEVVVIVAMTVTIALMWTIRFAVLGKELARQLLLFIISVLVAILQCVGTGITYKRQILLDQFDTGLLFVIDFVSLLINGFYISLLITLNLSIEIGLFSVSVVIANQVLRKYEDINDDLNIPLNNIRFVGTITSIVMALVSVWNLIALTRVNQFAEAIQMVNLSNNTATQTDTVRDSSRDVRVNDTSSYSQTRLNHNGNSNDNTRLQSFGTTTRTTTSSTRTATTRTTTSPSTRTTVTNRNTHTQEAQDLDQDLDDYLGHSRLHEFCRVFSYVLTFMNFFFLPAYTLLWVDVSTLTYGCNTIEGSKFASLCNNDNE